MSRHRFDLSSTIVVALLAAGLALVGIHIPFAQLVLTILLVLVLPGYALTAALFPSRAFGVLERVAFTLGLSLCVAVLGGIVLNQTPWGLQASSWAVLLSSITVLAATAALLQQRGAPAPAFAAPAGRAEQLGTARRWIGGFDVRYLVALGLAGGIVAGTLQSTRITASDQASPQVTQLWLVPVADSNTVKLGIGSLEAVNVDYKLQLRSKNQVLQEWPSIVLKPGERWETSVELTAASGSGEVEAVLYRSNAPQDIYRRVVIKPNT